LTSRPITPGSPPKRRFQRLSESITTRGALRSSSPRAKARPTRGTTPNIRGRPADIRTAASVSGSPAPVSV
jgi:hypothetical protein